MLNEDHHAMLREETSILDCFCEIRIEHGPDQREADLSGDSLHKVILSKTCLSKIHPIFCGILISAKLIMYRGASFQVDFRAMWSMFYSVTSHF